MNIVAISGGFDPVTIGHIRYIQESATYGRLHIFLNTDKWLMRKKGYVFMPFKERAEILHAFRGVEMVIPAMDDDGTVCENIKMFLKPGDIFANGGDRNAKNTPELKVCSDMKIRTMFGIGGRKIQSSSDLVKKVRENA